MITERLREMSGPSKMQRVMPRPMKQRREEASIAFFKNIEAALALELKKANPELHRYDLLVGHKAGGISMDPKRFETQVRLSYGRASSCEVNLDQANATIQVEMLGEPDASGIAVPRIDGFPGHSHSSRLGGTEVGIRSTGLRPYSDLRTSQSS